MLGNKCVTCDEQVAYFPEFYWHAVRHGVKGANGFFYAINEVFKPSSKES